MRFVKPPTSTRGWVTTKNYSSDGRTHHPKWSETPSNFVAVDGEGVTIAGEHRYVLLGVGGNRLERPDGIRWTEAFDFLYGFYQPRTVYVGFFLGYDFSQLWKTLPEERARMLLTSEGIALRRHRIPKKPPHPVEFLGWHFDILGTKRLRIRPKGCTCLFATCKCKHPPWLYLCDAGPFFQSSFLTVIDPKGWAEGTGIVTPEEFSLIETGKANRKDAVLDDDMRTYNSLENEVLVRVMSALDHGLHQIGIHLTPSQWFGPGQAAQAWLKSVEAPTGELIREKVPAWFLEAARMTYFGGWFELFMHGIIPGNSHEYDINSAYPDQIAKLPCLLHGKYTHGTGIPQVDAGDVCAVYARVWTPDMPNNRLEQHIGAMLHRDPHGRILRPKATEGWFWWSELKAAEYAGCVKRLASTRGRQSIMKWVKYVPCDCPPPMQGIADLYKTRLQVGKTSPMGKAAKLVYNSVYGKAAQSVGDPMYGNPIYASLITSGCRTEILNAIATHPARMAGVSMVATDAVYFLTEHPGLKLSDQLGEWDHKVKSNLTLFKPGVYWDDQTRELLAAGDTPKFKARGFKASDFAGQIKEVDAVFAAWASDGTISGWPSVEFQPSFALTSALQALRRNDWESAGRVAQAGSEAITPLRQNADPRDKRSGLYPDMFDGRQIFRSQPHFGMALTEGRLQWIPSTPYNKRFGMEDPWSEEYRTQFGIHPDGLIGDILTWILKGE